MQVFRRRIGGNRVFSEVAIITDQYSPPSQELITPQVFLGEHRAALESSASAWNSIAKVADLGSDPEVVARVYASMDVCNTRENTERYINGKLSESDATRWTTEFSLYSLIATRVYQRTHKTDVMAASKAVGALYSNNNPYIRAVIQRTFPKSKLTEHTLKLAESFAEADSIAAPVINGLVQAQRQNPIFASEIFGARQKSEIAADPAIDELRRVVAVDWFHPAPEKSLLRNHVNEAKDHPENHLEHFIALVVGSEQNRRYATIRDMARFALAWQGVEQPDGISQVLRQTYSQWSSFTQLEKAFTEFTRQADQDEERGIGNLAGNPNDSSLKIRRHRTEDDRLSMSDVVTNMFLGRNQRREYHPKKSNLPTVNDLKKETAIGEEEVENQPSKRLYIVKSLPEGKHELVETGLDDLPATFGFGQHPADYQEDIKKMIKSIREDPLGRGTKKITKGSAVLRIAGNNVRLRCFSPLDRDVGRESRESLNLRIAYVVTKTDILIKDILKHREFDKKY